MTGKWSQRAIWASGVFLAASICYNLGQFVYELVGGENHRVTAGPVHDFGDVFWGQEKEHVFEIQNTWHMPLVIERVIAECGCTTISDELKGRTIAPQDTIEVPVRLQIGNMEGEFAKRVLIFFKEKSHPSIALMVKGIAKPGISWSPPEITFDTISTEDEVTKTITIRQVAGSPPITVRDVRSNSHFLSVQWERVASNDGRGLLEWVVRVSTVPPLPPGRVNQNFFVMTSDPVVNAIPVSVALIVRANAASRSGTEGERQASRANR